MTFNTSDLRSRSERFIRLATMAIVASFFVMARAPDSVEQHITLTGADAEAAVRLLGWPKEKAARFELPLESWFQPPTKKASSKGKKNTQPARNVLQFSLKGQPKLEIHPHWLDADTGSVLPVPRYTFSSPFIPADQLASSPWGPILSSLKISEKNASKARENARITLVDRQTGSNAKVLFTVRVDSNWHFRDGAKVDAGKASAADRTLVPGFVVTIGVDKRSPKERAKALKEHEKWLKENEDLE